MSLNRVQDNKKYGVINGDGKVIIYKEYDQIGINTTNFINNDIDNNYLLYNRYIPVMKDLKWGIIDVTGKITINVEFDGLGCTNGLSINKSENNVLLVPDVKGIVILKDNLYGIMSITGEKLVPTSVQEVYKVSTSGINTYYMTYNNEKIDAINWIKESQTR